ncbi:MAG TPA: condensation domain-containing protein, partial [Desulfobacteria bacterium]|nr:condensation domain-containing protein [Desulfobacteria bacterium]
MSYGVRRYPEILPKPKDLWYPLAYQQERVLYLSQLQPDSTIWGLISCKRLKGKLDITLLSDSIRELMDVHPVLRTKISYLDHGPVQKLVANDFNRLEVIDFSHLNVGQAAAEAREYYSKECKAAINVEGDRLFQAILIVISENEYMLILKIHHIISDATSLQIMWEDLKQIYNLSGRSEGLTPQAGVDYQDYVLWQREMFDALHTKEQEEYWLNEFKGEIPVLDLPHDFPSGSGFNFNGAFTKCEL